MENLKKLTEEKEYWNAIAMEFIKAYNDKDRDLYEAKKIIEGLLDDFKYFIGNVGVEPDRAGYILEAQKYLKEPTEL